MPALNDDEIKARIADGSISAITIDTQIFDKYGCNLRYALLRKLDQFRGGNISVLISEIVAGEIKSHIARDAAETLRALNSAVKSHRKRWLLSEPDSTLPATFKTAEDPAAIAAAQLAEYLEAIDGKILPATEPATVAPEVLRRYFAADPPFEASEKKKHEFPDAFALLSLEAWAAQQQTLLLCVSGDGGWRDFSTQSERLVWVCDLNQALSFFNESGRTIADQTVILLRAGETPEFTAEIDRAFEYRLDDQDYHIEAWSALEFEAEPLSAVVQSIDWDSASPPSVVAADDDCVTFTVRLTATVEFEALFSYHHYDSFDRDYVSLGSEEESVQRDIEFELAIEVSREEPIQIVQVEVAKRFFEVNFGEVEPFKHEDPTHEKY